MPEGRDRQVPISLLLASHPARAGKFSQMFGEGTSVPIQAPNPLESRELCRGRKLQDKA